MEPEIVKHDHDYKAEAETPKVEVNLEEAGELNPLPSAEHSTEQWLLLGYRISAFLDELPSYVTYFFEAYKRLLITIGLILAAFVTVKLMLAVLNAINDIPLLVPTFELIGLAYTTWFVYRYLIGATSRQELSEEIKTLKEYVLSRRN